MFLTHIYYLISSSFTRMLTYSKLKYIINIVLSLTCDLPKYACHYMIINCIFPTKSAEQWSLSHLTPWLFQIFITTFKMEDQRGIITIDIISLIISMIIKEEHGKTIDIIFIDAKQYDGRKDISIIKTNCMH